MSAPNGTKNRNVNNTAKSSGTIDSYPLIQMLVRRRWQLLACLLLVCGTAISSTLMRKPKYESKARVQVVMDQPSIGGGIAGLQNSGDYFTTQVQLLQSRHVYAAAAKKLNMSGGNWQLSEEGLKALSDNVSVIPVPGSRLIDIIGISEDAPMAAAIANQITAAFIETSTAARKAGNKRIIERVNQQIEKYDNEIQEKEDLVNKFRQENLITAGDTTLSAVENRIRSIEEKLTLAQMTRLNLETKRGQIQKMLSTGRGLGENDTTLIEIDQNDEVRAISSNLYTLSDKESQLANVYLPGHPKLRDLRLRIAGLQTKLLDKKQNLMHAMIEGTTEKYTEIVKQENSLLALLNQQKEFGVKLTQKNQLFNELKRDLERARVFKNQCINQVREFTLGEGMSESPVIVVDAAQPSSKPAGLSKSKQAASILLLGILFSLAFVFAIDRMSQPATTSSTYGDMFMQNPAMAQMAMPSWPGFWPQPGMPQETQAQAAGTPETSKPVTEPVAEQKTDVDPMQFNETVTANQNTSMAQLNDIELGNSSYNDLAFAARCRIIHADQSSSEAAAFRDMGNRLMSRFGQTKQAFVVTSKNANEGKTTCACNLAIGLAKAGRRVLLIDVNQYSPSLHKVFSGSAGKPDLPAILMDVRNIDNALVDPDIMSLKVLPVNTSNSQHINMDMLENALHELKQSFDWIIFDAGTIDQPITQQLLNTVGKSLLVTSSNDKAQHEKLSQQVELSGAVCIGFVENSHTISSPMSQSTNVNTL